MPFSIKALSLAIASALAASGTIASAGPLQQASISQIVNDVKVVDPAKGARAARLQETVRDEVAVRTGVGSRAELLFQDNTLTRLGAETFFSFQGGTRDISLERGTMLLQVPKNLGGARIRTASVTASITGTTIMIEHLPKKHLKVVVLEGSLRLSVNGRMGEAMLLTPGKMVIMNPAAKSIPEPVQVDLRKMMKTSSLIDGKGLKGKGGGKIAALPSAGLIEKEIARQDQLVKEKGLIPTNLVIDGSGTEVRVASDETLAMLESGDGRGKRGPGRSDLSGRLASEDTMRGGIEERVKAADRKESGQSDGAEDGGKGGNGGKGNEGSGGDGGGDGDGSDGDDEEREDVTETAGFVRPDWSAAAQSSTFSPTHPVPVTIATPAPFALELAHRFNLAAPLPTVSAGGIKNTGTIYGGPAIDGPAAQFLFGSSTNFDAATRFDSRFGVGNRTSFPAAGSAVFQFADLTIGPLRGLSDRASIRDLALLSAGSITNGATATGMSLGNLDSLTLATLNGPITLGAAMPINASAESGFDFLHLYARGATGAVHIDNAITFPDAGLYVDAEAGIFTGASSVLKVDHAAFNSAGNVALNGKITAATLQFDSKQDLVFAGEIASGRLAAFGSTFELQGGSITGETVSITTTGDIRAGGASSIQAKRLELNAGGALALNQIDPAKTRIDLSQAESFSGRGLSITFAGSDFIVPDGVRGTLKSGGNIDATGTRLAGFDSIEATGNITAPVITGDTRVRADGSVAAFQIDVTDSLDIKGALLPLGGFATDGTTYSIVAKSLKADGGIQFVGTAGSGQTAAGAGGTLLLGAESLTFGPGGIGGANLDGGSGQKGEGGDGGNLTAGTAAKPISRDVRFSAPVSASTGANKQNTPHGGKGGSVSVVASSEIRVDSSIQVSGSAGAKASRQGGSISLESRRSNGTAISIGNSGQLLALLDSLAPGPGGTIRLVSAGGDIRVDSGTVVADRGSVEMTNSGERGDISLKNSNIRGDVVKIGALGANGQLLIGGGTINADTILKLYADGTDGMVRFTQDVTLGGASTKIIAGRTVQIDNNRTVTVGGSSAASVFTDRPNYTGSGGNGSTSGKFGGAGATTQPHNSRPAF